jgi:hypothetical protein
MLSKPIQDLKKREADHAAFLQRGASASKPKPDSNGIVLLTGTRAVASSPASSIGIVDGQGITEEARAWLRESTSAHDQADETFFTRKTRNSERLWNDPAVPDSAFAADAEVSDHRQTAPTRPRGQVYLNSMRIGILGVAEDSSVKKASTR